MGIFQHWPNRITALRFVGALVLFGILAFHKEADDGDHRLGRGILQVAFWLFVATAATDWLDGWLARRGNLVSAFGRIADPFVDKVLVLGSMVFLAVLPWSKEWFPAWVVVVVMAREFLITGLRGYVESLGCQFPADMFGKVKLVVQCLAVGFVLGIHAFTWSRAAVDVLSVLAHVLVWGTVATTLGSCASYLARTRRILQEQAA